MAREHNPVRFRVYAETLSPREAANPATVALLRKYGCDIVLAVRPPHADQIADAVARLRGGGVEVALWPMIEDERGRWPSARNAAPWIEFAASVLARVRAAKEKVTEVLFDLEPPFGTVRALTPGHFAPTALAKMARLDRYRRGRAELVGYRERLRREDVRVSAAIVPLCVFSTHWERALGTPVTALAADLPSVMAYTTIYEGWSRRIFSRSDALALLDATARAALHRYGAHAGISLGTVGTGAFEDEPIYRSPDELAADAAVAQKAGARNLTLFDLGGISRRGPAEAWLDAFTAPSVAPVLTSRRIELLVRALGGRLPLT